MLRVLHYHSDCECHLMGGFKKMYTLNCKSISAISDAVPVTMSEIVIDESMCFQSFQII